MQGFDNAVVAFFQGAGSNPFLDAVMPFVTGLADHGIVWIALCAALLFSKRYRHWGIAAGCALAATFFCDEFVLKSIFLRPRPFVADPSVVLLVDPPGGYSFPSGHSATALAVAVTLLFSPLKKRWKAAVLVFALLVAFSRAYLCVHYATDVLAGIAVGTLFGICAGLLARRAAAARPAAGSPREAG